MQHAIDPVCGMEVDPGTSAQASFQSRTFYFCSEQCHRAFRQDPARYAERSERQEPSFTVTDKLAAPKFGSAGSGGLENEPGPERHDRP